MVVHLIEDLKHALEMDELPDEENYETLAGFMMYCLRKFVQPTLLNLVVINLKLLT